MRTPKPDMAALIERMPGADRPDQESKMTGDPWSSTGPVCDEVLSGGKESLLELIDSIRDEQGQGARNYKPGYLLHAVAIHVGRPRAETSRRLVEDALLERVGGSDASAAIRRFLVRELRVVGSERSVEALSKLLADPELCEDATQALISIRSGAAAALRSALGRASGACRLTIIQALGVLEDREALDALREAARGADRELRMAAVWALARSGGDAAVEAVITATDADDQRERTRAVKAALILAESLAKAGAKDGARRVYRHLQETRTSPAEAYVRDVAVLALATLG